MAEAAWVAGPPVPYTWRAARVDTLLEEQIIAHLNSAGQHLATAESCTGGLITHRLTNVPGASGCLRGGIVAYDDAIKEKVLGVDKATLTVFGAVSEATAREMAHGAQRVFGADYALAVTGIAGPSGGSDDKPVGLVVIAAARPGEAWVTRNQFEGGREAIKNQSADAALAMILEWIR